MSHAEPFRSFFDLANQGFAITAPDTRWLHVNASICRMLGYSEEELRRLTWVELTHPEDRALDLHEFRRLMAGHIDDYQLLKRFVRKDRSLLHASFTVSALRDAAGEVVQVNATLLDRTEEQQALEALRLSEERFRLLAEREALYRNIADYTFDWETWTDADGTLRYCSPSCERISGYSADAFLDDATLFERIVHPDDRAAWEAHQTGLLGTSPEALGAASITHRILGADGGVRWLERVDYAMHTDDGTYAGIRSSTRDITEIRATQAELERQKDFVEAVLGTARALILVLGPGAEVVRVSPYVEQVTGWRPQELIGRDWIDTCVPPDRRERLRRMFAQAWSTRRTDGTVTELMTKSGEIRHMRWYDEMLEAPEGETPLLVAVGVDVTEQLAVEQALHRLNEQLEQKVAERTRELEVATAAMIQSEKLGTVGTMVAGLAHEINNPLMGLGSYIGYARERTDGRVQEMLGKADAQIARISGILSNLLQYARPASDDGRECVEMVSAARHAADLVAAELRRRGVQLVDCLPGRLPCICAEPGPLQQVMLNLMINARDALSRDTSAAGVHADDQLSAIRLEGGVRVDRNSAQQWVWIEVRDNGPGVPDKIRHSIFDPFFTTKPRGQGTGLGLSVSLGIVAGFGGELSLRQADAGGAVFRVELPAAGGDCRPAAQAVRG